MSSSQGAAANPDLLWSAAKLREMLGTPGLSVVDTRPAELFAAGRIPGARHFDPYFVNCDDTDPAPLASFTRMWANMLGWRGVKPADTIVFYGAFTDMCAARGFWFAEYLGCENVHVLDGGIKAWAEAGLPIERESGPPQPNKFPFEAVAGRVATYASILAAIDDPRCLILDNRSRAEFTGDDRRARHGGAIPSARHCDWEDLYDHASGLMKSPSELRAIFEARGVTAGQGNHGLLQHRLSLGARLSGAAAARIPQRAQLRRLLAGVGQPRRLADRAADLASARRRLLLPPDLPRRAPCCTVASKQIPEERAMASHSQSPLPSGIFTIQSQERIVFGEPAGKALLAEIERLGARRVFVTSTRSLAKLSDGPLQKIEAALGALHVGSFSAISSHSPREDVIAGATAARAADADLMVAVGGGSVIDATKAMLMCLWHGVDSPAGMEPYRSGRDDGRIPDADDAVGRSGADGGGADDAVGGRVHAQRRHHQQRDALQAVVQPSPVRAGRSDPRSRVDARYAAVAARLDRHPFGRSRGRILLLANRQSGDRTAVAAGAAAAAPVTAGDPRAAR